MFYEYNVGDSTPDKPPLLRPQMISAYLAKRNARSSSANHSEGGGGNGGGVGGGSQSSSSGGGGGSAPQTGVVSYTRPRPSLGGGPDGRSSDGSRGENTSLLDTPVHSMVPTLSPTHSSPHAGSLSPGAAGESELTCDLHKPP